MQSGRLEGGSSANILLGLSDSHSGCQPVKHPHELIGLAACRYARQIVLKSASAIESNDLPDDKFAMLRAGVEQMRAVVSDLKLHPAQHMLDPDTTIAFFNNTNALTRKYSLGNCFEYACLALEYVYQQHAGIEAEVFDLYGGDHIFLVIGHKKTNSFNCSDPCTWGDSAYICDPWRNSVYPAIEYKTKLTNYYLKEAANVRSINVIEPLQPHHVLGPYKYEFNTSYLAKQETLEYKQSLMQVFQYKIAALRQTTLFIWKKARRLHDHKVEARFNAILEALSDASKLSIEWTLSCDKIRECLEDVLIERVVSLERLITQMKRQASTELNLRNACIEAEKRLSQQLTRTVRLPQENSLTKRQQTARSQGMGR